MLSVWENPQVVRTRKLSSFKRLGSKPTQPDSQRREVHNIIYEQVPKFRGEIDTGNGSAFGLQD